MSPIDLPKLLLLLAKAEYCRADTLEDGWVDAVLLVKTHNGIRVDIFEDWEDENVNDNTSREAKEAGERLLQIHAEQLVCHAALHLGYGEPPGAGVFPIHNFARTRQLWRRVPGGLADGEQGTTDWFFPVALLRNWSSGREHQLRYVMGQPAWRTITRQASKDSSRLSKTWWLNPEHWPIRCETSRS